MNPSAPIPVPPSSDIYYGLVLLLLLLAPLAIAGLALVNTGLGRSRSAAQAILGNLAFISVAVIAFALFGAAIAGSLPGTPGGAGHAFHAAGQPWNWIGSGSFLLSGFGSAPLPAQLALLFEMAGVAFAVIIPWGSGAERWRLAAGCAASALIAGIVCPLIMHWIWGGGWLAGLGTNFSLGAGFLDPGGAASVQVVGGLSALALIWLLGPRAGKYPRTGISTAMPGHNAVYVLFGCLLGLVGWLAWNAAGAILWMNAPLAALPVVAVNTVLSAASALGATLAITRYRFGKPDASLCANGWLAGLVTSSACAAVATPVESIFAGLVAGVITPLLVELLELALSIDDPSGAIAAHAAAGLWGLLAVGFFAPKPGQLIAQLTGIATLLGLVLPLVYLLFAVLNRFVPFRVDPDGERMGMDLHELGGGAYPEFVIHRDESYR
ncbi:MAG: ammonium transporter [Terracidiphilus sp.]